ncbi:MAG TPA: amidohydrolase family protein, partial [Pyrinomonadaceae bacterium]
MKKRILSLILLTVSTSAIRAQTNDQIRPPIIDVHVHAYEKDERWTNKAPNPRTGVPLTATTEHAHMQATFAEMKKYNIVKAVVSNHYPAVLRWNKASPDRVIVSYGFDDPAKVDLPFLRKEHAAGRLMALGEVAIQYEGISPNDPKMEPIWALAEELDLPVGFHTGLGPMRTPYTCCPKFRNSFGNPALLEEVLIRHPKLRVYLMHAGFPYMQETFAIMHMYPQV